MKFLEDIQETIPQRYTTIRYNELPDDFEKNPTDTLDELNKQYREGVARVNKRMADLYNDWAVRVDVNPEESLPVTDVSVAQRETWVTFRGVVARIKKPEPRILHTAWVCNKCGNVIELPPEMGKPKMCLCKSVSFTKNVKMSTIIDSQNIILTENFEEVRGSRPPMMLDCMLDGSLLWSLSPGDRCAISGVLELVDTKNRLDYILKANNVIDFRATESTIEPPKIEGDIMQTLVKSFAPKIFGHDTIKESILLLLTGGVAEEGNRHNINMLLVGDPGIAKSALLRETAAVAPLGRYTSGRGSTAAGLTAGMARDRDGVMYLEAGAAVLTDTGVLCLDEFDKMTTADRASLHEVMEQQTVSITKLGVMVTMNARISILAAANPKEGFWDDGLSLAENIDLPDSLMTRFDLIYNLKDIPNAESDGLIAEHLFSGDAPNILSREEITAYIRDIRGLEPVFTPEAISSIKQYYIKARNTPGEIRITPRQLEAIKRLAGARAKIYRRDDITTDDTTRAMFLVETMIQRTLSDPTTGRPDYLKATTGKSGSAVRRVDEVTRYMESEFCATDLIERLNMPLGDIEKALDKLHTSGQLLEGASGLYRRA